MTMQVLGGYKLRNGGNTIKRVVYKEGGFIERVFEKRVIGML